MRCFKVLTIIFIIILASGCRDKSSDLAEVNGEKITKEEFNSYLEFKRINNKQKERVEKHFDNYIKRAALAKAIENEGFFDDSMIQTELNEFKKQMLINRYFEKFLRDKVTKTAIQNYYNSHSKEFESEKAHVAHILVRTNKSMGETERKSKLTKLQEAVSKIRSGIKFEDAAIEYSEDNISSKKGGDLGWIKKGSIDPVLSKKAFELKQDEISKPFETQFGFHIVKLLDAPKTIKQPLNKVYANIRYQLRAEAKKAEMDRLRKDIEIKKLNSPVETTEKTEK